MKSETKREHMLQKAGRSEKGSTLVEVLIASTILLIALFITYIIWTSVMRNFRYINAQAEARQEIRKISAFLSKDIRSACFVFKHPAPPVLQEYPVLNGISYQIPCLADPAHESEIAPPYAGQALLLAIPEDPAESSGKYTLVGYTLVPVPNAPADFRDLIRYEVPGIVPPISNTPSSIDLNSGAIPGSENIRTVARFSGEGGFSARLLDQGAAVEVRLVWEARVPKSMPSVKAYDVMRLNIRDK